MRGGGGFSAAVLLVALAARTDVGGLPTGDINRPVRGGISES